MVFAGYAGANGAFEWEYFRWFLVGMAVVLFFYGILQYKIHTVLLRG